MKSPNAYVPYHNVRHMLHVFWETYDGCVYMNLSKIEMRILLISALFHDYNHTGKKGDDSINIKRAFEALDEYLLEEDKKYISDIKRAISSTEYPYDENKKFNINDLILRDADQSQTFSSVWIQSVLYGLEELGMSYEQMLKLQRPFLEKMKFHTEWGIKKFQPLIESRLKLVDKMISAMED